MGGAACATSVARWVAESWSTGSRSRHGWWRAFPSLDPRCKNRAHSAGASSEEPARGRVGCGRAPVSEARHGLDEAHHGPYVTAITSPGFSMSSWHRVGSEADLVAGAPLAVKIERHRIAIFHYDGRLHAISDICNHRGGPLSDGRLHGEFVMCPWHAWEYSVITGKGPEGYDEEQVPVYRLEVREDGVYVELPPAMPRHLLKHKPSHLLEPHPKPADAPPRVLGISTTGMDAVNPRFSTSDCLLEHAVEHLGAQGADTSVIRLRELTFRHCEGNYSKASHACTWPCAITERDPTDELTEVYEGRVHWADVVLLA